MFKSDPRNDYIAMRKKIFLKNKHHYEQINGKREPMAFGSEEYEQQVEILTEKTICNVQNSADLILDLTE